MAQKYSAEQDNYIDFNCSKAATAQTNVVPYKTTDIDVLMQELEVLLTTSPYDVFNAADEFIDLRSYVFKTQVSASTLENKLRTIIENSVYVPDNLSVEISVQFMKGTQSDIGVIDVKVSRNTDYTMIPEYQRRVFTFA